MKQATNYMCKLIKNSKKKSLELNNKDVSRKRKKKTELNTEWNKSNKIDYVKK